MGLLYEERFRELADVIRQSSRWRRTQRIARITLTPGLFAELKAWDDSDWHYTEGWAKRNDGRFYVWGKMYGDDWWICVTVEAQV